MISIPDGDIVVSIIKFSIPASYAQRASAVVDVPRRSLVRWVACTGFRTW
jgi:hypothetical protein